MRTGTLRSINVAVSEGWNPVQDQGRVPLGPSLGGRTASGTDSSSPLRLERAAVSVVKQQCEKPFIFNT
jgi:hypothetical protein